MSQPPARPRGSPPGLADPDPKRPSAAPEGRTGARAAAPYLARRPGGAPAAARGARPRGSGRPRSDQPHPGRKAGWSGCGALGGGAAQRRARGARGAEPRDVLPGRAPGGGGGTEGRGGERGGRPAGDVRGPILRGPADRGCGEASGAQRAAGPMGLRGEGPARGAGGGRGRTHPRGLPNPGRCLPLT